MNIELRNRFFAGKYRVGKGVANYSGIDNQDLINCENLDELISSPSAMNSVLNNEIAMDTISNSRVAMGSFTSSEELTSSVLNSQVAINSIAKSSIAMNRVMDALVSNKALLTETLSQEIIMDAIWGNATGSSVFWENIINQDLPRKISHSDSTSYEFSITDDGELYVYGLVGSSSSNSSSSIDFDLDLSGISEFRFEWKRERSVAGHTTKTIFRFDGDNLEEATSSFDYKTVVLDVSGYSGVTRITIQQRAEVWGNDIYASNFIKNLRLIKS